MELEPKIKRYDKNPSVELIELDTKTKLKKIKTRGNGTTEWANTESGEVIGGGAMLFEREEVDAGKFVKLYTAGVAAVAGLSKTGVKLLEILMSEMQHGADTVFLHSATICKTYGISKNTFSRGICDLRQRAVIFDHANGYGWYFVNVAYIFKGDRYVVVKEYRLSSNTKKIENPNQGRLL